MTLGANASFAMAFGFPPAVNNTFRLSFNSFAYTDYNTQITLEMVNSCIPSQSDCLTSLGKLLQTTSGYVYLLMTGNSVFDFAFAPNGNLPLLGPRALPQGAPGFRQSYSNHFKSNIHRLLLLRARILHLIAMHRSFR